MIGNAPQIARRGYPRVTALAMLLGLQLAATTVREEGLHLSAELLF
jgi:hypothetical protein